MVSWEDSKSKLEGDPAFESIADESDRIRIFKVYKINGILKKKVYKLNSLHAITIF